MLLSPVMVRPDRFTEPQQQVCALVVRPALQPHMKLKLKIEVVYDARRPQKGGKEI